MENFTLVIFGITSNLAQIKLIPTLYDLVAGGRLDCHFSVIGVGRTQMDHSEFKAYISKTLRAPNRHHTHEIDETIEQKLLDNLTYLPADLTNQASFEKLKDLIEDSGNAQNRMFYLATFPSIYESIFTHLKSTGLTEQKDGWTRVLIEKPIGTDQSSAAALNSLLTQYFSED